MNTICITIFLDFGEIILVSAAVCLRRRRRRRRGEYFFAAGIWFTVIKNGESVQRKCLF